MKRTTSSSLKLSALCIALVGCSAIGSNAGSDTTSQQRWQPAVSDTWQWQLTGELNTSYDVDVYDIDLFDTPASAIAALQSQGRRVVCYFSAGSSENWRDDFGEFTQSDMGNPLDGWAGERWLDTSSDNVRAIMARRLDLAAEKGCDGVEPDNMDGYQNDPGLALTSAKQINYAHYLAETAHGLGLAIGLKNSTDNVSKLAKVFDFAVNEECFQYEECDVYSAFIKRGKPVFSAEYEDKFLENTGGARDKICAASRVLKLHTLVLAWDLDDSIRYSCDSDFAG